MPCNCDYMEPSTREKELQNTAGLLLFLYDKLGYQIPVWIIKESQNIYCNNQELVPLLCKELHELLDKGQERFDSIVYNGKDKNSRMLADWWEKHLEADRIREAKEKEERRLEEIRNNVINRMTLEEKKAFGIE